MVAPFVTPEVAPRLTDILSVQPQVGDPYIEGHEKNVRAFQKLPGRIAAAEEDLIAQGLMDAPFSDPVRAALDNFNTRRVARGAAPTSLPESITMLQSGESLEPVNPVPERSWWNLPSNVINDLQDIFTAIPKLPSIMFQQGRQLDQIGPGLQQVMSGDFEKLQEVPLINMIPGTYALSNILSGNIDELARRPVMTALDVAPLAGAKVMPAATKAQLSKRIARTPKLGRSMRGTDEVLAAGRLVSEKIDEGVKAGLTPEKAMEAVRFNEFEVAKSLGTFGDPQSFIGWVANTTPLGTMSDVAKNWARSSRVGQWAQRSVGANARNATMLNNYLDNAAMDLFNPASPGWLPDGEYTRAAAAKLPDGRPSKFHYSVRDVIDFREKYMGDEAFKSAGYQTQAGWIARRKEVTKMMERKGKGDMSGLTPFESQMVADAHTIANKIIMPHTAISPQAYFLNPNQYSFIEMNMRKTEGMELLDADNAMQLHKKRMTATEYGMRRVLADPDTPLSLEFLASDQWRQFMQDPTISMKSKDLVLKTATYRMLDEGIDITSPVNQQMLRRGAVSPEHLSFLDEVSQPHFSRAQILDVIQPRTTKGGRTRVPEELRVMHEAVKRGDWTTAFRDYRDKVRKTRRKAKLPTKPQPLDEWAKLDPPADPMFRALKQASEIGDHLKAEAKLRLDVEQALWRRADKYEVRQAVPARFYPKAEELASKKAEAFAGALTKRLGVDPAEATRLTQHVREGVMGPMEPLYAKAQRMGTTKAQMNALADPIDGQPLFAKTGLDGNAPLPPALDDLLTGFGREAELMWADLKNAGFDPYFVHHVADDAAKMPRVRPKKGKISQAKNRTVMFAPHSDDVAVALTHQQGEWITRHMNDMFIETLAKGDPNMGVSAFAVTRADLEQQLMPQAQYMARNGKISVYDAMEKLINRQFDQFNPGDWLSTGKKGSPWATEQLYMDKSMIKVIEDLATPAQGSALLDPIMATFRTSVLTLSPRWQIYNLLGNAVFMMMERGGKPLKYLKDATDVIRWNKKAADAAAKGIDIPPPPAVMDKISKHFRMSLNQHGREVAEFQGLAGRAVGRHMTDATAEGLRKATKGAKATQDFIVKMNANVDDAYRIMFYLDEMDQAAKKISPKARSQSKLAGRVPEQLAAEQAVRRFMYSWDTMTPFERQAMRMVFPFYGFMGHVMRFAFNYTVDHPLRMAVIAGFARAEIADWQDGVPERFRRGMMFLNPLEPGKKQKGINIAGWNPFSDIGSMLTLSGLLSQVNPLLSTTLEQMGIDPRTGQASLYPTSTYDPETGRLKLANRNFLTAAIENLIPQTQLVTSRLGLNQDLADMERTNPEAKRRLELSSIGVPTLLREVDPSYESMAAEVARRSAYRTEVAQAVRTPGRASAYPQLREVQQQILALQATQPEATARYTPAKVADIQAGILENV